MAAAPAPAGAAVPQGQIRNAQPMLPMCPQPGVGVTGPHPGPLYMLIGQNPPMSIDGHAPLPQAPLVDAAEKAAAEEAAEEKAAGELLLVGNLVSEYIGQQLKVFEAQACARISLPDGSLGPSPPRLQDKKKWVLQWAQLYVHPLRLSCRDNQARIEHPDPPIPAFPPGWTREQQRQLAAQLPRRIAMMAWGGEGAFCTRDRIYGANRIITVILHNCINFGIMGGGEHNRQNRKWWRGA
jgi:hypothetical protein